MNFKSILFVGLVFTLISVDLCGQEVDYASLKEGDILPSGLISSEVKQIGKSSLKRVFLRQSLDYQSGTVKTIVFDEQNFLEFNNWVNVEVSDDFIVVSDKYGNINIYDKKLFAISSFNIRTLNIWKQSPDTHLFPQIIRSNLFLFYYGSQIVFINSLGEVVFEYDNAFEGNGFIHYMNVFEKDDNELVVDLWNYNDEREVYLINLARRHITKGPDIDNLAKENNLGETKNLYYSTVSGFFYVNCQNKFFITDWNQTFLTIQSDKLRYDFNIYNPIHINNSNRILLYCPKYVNELQVMDSSNGTMVESIKFKEFFSETKERIDRVTLIVESINNYTITGRVSNPSAKEELIILNSEVRLESENYKVMTISQMTKLPIKDPD